MMQIQFTRSALDDLDRLRTFIAEKNPTAATRIAHQLVAGIRKLASQPEMGRLVKGVDNVRDWVTGDYIARYQVRENILIILRVWHEKEDR